MVTVSMSNATETEPMSSLTLKNLPTGLLERLRKRADSEHRSINRQAIAILEAALPEDEASFGIRLAAFLDKWEGTGLDADEEVAWRITGAFPGGPAGAQ
ncbi:MAG: plasmid stability protein [Rhodothermales bacterium]|jgi:plasmid stability protein